MNKVFIIIVFFAFAYAGWQQIVFIPGQADQMPMETLSKAMIDSGGAAILPTTLFATIGSTSVAIIAAKVYQRFFPQKQGRHIKNNGQKSEDLPIDDTLKNASEGYPLWVSILALGILASLIPMAILYGRVVSPWILPGLMVGFLGFGLVKKVQIYEVFVEGAKEGFQVIVNVLSSVIIRFGLPAEALPMALMRPFSGSGSYAILASIINDPSVGPDSYTGLLVSTLQGSTETTFYVMAVYFGAVQIKKIRHALMASLTADVAGVLFAILACSLLLNL